MSGDLGGWRDGPSPQVFQPVAAAQSEGSRGPNVVLALALVLALVLAAGLAWLLIQERQSRQEAAAQNMRNKHEISDLKTRLDGVKATIDEDRAYARALEADNERIRQIGRPDADPPEPPPRQRYIDELQRENQALRMGRAPRAVPKRDQFPSGGDRGGGTPQPPPPSPPPTAQPKAPQLDVRGRIVPLLPLQPRINRAGGHAVVLMTHPREYTAAQQARHQSRNRLLCEALLANFLVSSYQSAEVGMERVEKEGGRLVRIRPIYWPQTTAPPGPGSRCAQLMRVYDTTRAAAILDKMEYRDVGPYLVVSNDDQRFAATIDMTDLSDAQIAPMVKYFRNRFSQKERVWMPEVTTVAETRDGLLSEFGNLFADNLSTAVQLFSVAQVAGAKVSGGCIGDASDTRRC